MKEKIRFAEFNLLNNNQKMAIINQEGFFIFSKHGKRQRKLVYQVNSFYAEITYDLTNMKGIRTFNSSYLKTLEPFDKSKAALSIALLLL
jgi:hypothetical protein